MALKHDDIRSRVDYYKIDPTKIKVVDGWNERTEFGDIKELSQSIINSGLKNPIHVFRNKNNEFELVDGERRLRAVLYAIDNGIEVKSIMAFLVSKKTNPIDKILTQLLANGGKPFTPVEEAGIYKRLINAGLTVKDIHDRTGKSLTHVYQRLELGRATPEVIAALKEGRITINEARDIGTNNDSIESQSKQLADKMVTGLKVKKGVFSFDKVNKSIAREFKKFNKVELHQPGARKQAITQLKNLVAELEAAEEQSIPEVDHDQLSLLKEV